MFLIWGGHMARKESITAEIILNTAFEMTCTEGFEGVTARKLANKIGCSTQPIFRVYENMGELDNEIYQKAIHYFDEYYMNFTSQETTPFVHLGLAYIQFATEEKNLFKLLFLSDKRGDRGMYELLNGNSGAVTKEINRATEAGCKNPSVIFMKMWIFIHGAACMVLTGDYDLSQEETAVMLTETFHSIAGI